MATPPDFQIRRSARARRISLRLSSAKGLEVVVPTRVHFDRDSAERFVESHRSWIERQRERLQLSPTPTRSRRPRTIDFRALGRKLAIRYERDDRSRRMRVFPEGEHDLVVRGDLQRSDVVLQTLLEFVRRTGRRVLPGWLAEHAARHGFGYRRTSVRLQRSRWGSCSSRGTISLNAKLLFLPRPLVDYVLLHELCHTRHLNHSRAFWELVRRLEPDADERERSLGAWERRLPAWLR